MKKLTLLLCAAALAGVSSASGATLSLTDSADTSLRNDGGGPGNNFGANNQLLLGSNSGYVSALVAFDLSSLATLGAGQTITINSVSLNLHTTTTAAGSGSAISLTLYSYGYNFVEGAGAPGTAAGTASTTSATWTNPAGGVGTDVAGGTQGAGTQLQTVSGIGSAVNQSFAFATSAALSSYLSSALTGGRANFLIADNDGDPSQKFMRVDSRDAVLNGITGAVAPTLVIDYTLTAVPEPSTYGLLGAGALAGVALVRRRRRAA